MYRIGAGGVSRDREQRSADRGDWAVVLVTLMNHALQCRPLRYNIEVCYRSHTIVLLLLYIVNVVTSTNFPLNMNAVENVGKVHANTRFLYYT